MSKIIPKGMTNGGMINGLKTPSYVKQENRNYDMERLNDRLSNVSNKKDILNFLNKMKTMPYDDISYYIDELDNDCKCPTTLSLITSGVLIEDKKNYSMFDFIFRKPKPYLVSPQWKPSITMLMADIN